MLIYNVTTKVSSAIHHDWLAWMQNIHIPAVMQTGFFREYKILRLLDIDDSEGPTYAIQYFAANRANYESYIASFAPALRKETTDKWGQQIIGFRSLMEVVN